MLLSVDGSFRGRYDKFRQAWETDKNCRKMRELSDCVSVWEEGDRSVEEAKKRIAIEKASGKSKPAGPGKGEGWKARHEADEKKKGKSDKGKGDKVKGGMVKLNVHDR